MQENKEIQALFHLIDDPDEEIFSKVSEKIIDYGRAIIPNLENLWETTPNEDIQERIEQIIHRVHFRELSEDFSNWKNGTANLLEGALLVARYHYPEMQASGTLQEIEKIRRNIWLELNSYLTSLEQISVITSILYNYFKLSGNEIAYHQPEDFLINKVTESKNGNAISNGVLYLILCNLLDVPVKAINIPKQFILAYFDPRMDISTPASHTSDKISFYIDPLNGQLYTHKDVENYFKRISVPPTISYFRPLSNKKIIQFLLEELSKCFDNTANLYKKEELLLLANLLDA